QEYGEAVADLLLDLGELSYVGVVRGRVRGLLDLDHKNVRLVMAGLVDDDIRADPVGGQHTVRIGQCDCLRFDAVPVVLSVNRVHVKGPLEYTAQLRADRTLRDIEPQYLQVLGIQSFQRLGQDALYVTSVHLSVAAHVQSGPRKPRLPMAESTF